MYWSDAQWWAWIPMIVAMIVFLGLVAWVAIRLLAPPGAGGRTSSPAPQEILDVRLARGEITREDYEELAAVLRAEHHGSASSQPPAAPIT